MLFRLPECYLQCSAFFRERLNAEQVPNEPPHLLLENVTVAEFRSLLNVMTRSASEYVSHGITTTAAGLIVVFCVCICIDCSRYALMRPLRVPSPGVDSDYPSVLKLATLWGFENIRRHMIRKLRSLEDPVLKLSLARKYNVTEFLPDAITELVERPCPLVLGDYEMLGIELAVQVTQYRELCHRAEK